MPWTDSRIDPDFRQWIMDFPTQQTPLIRKMIAEYEKQVDVIVFNTREDSDAFIDYIN